MTIRKQLNLKKRLTYIIFFGGFIVSAILAKTYPGDQHNFPPLFVFIPFGVGILATFFAQFVIRCPVCKGNLGRIMMTSGNPFSMSKEVHYCPYCGTDVDKEI